MRMKDGRVLNVPIVIDGPRVSLRPITLDDADDVYAEFTPEIATYMFPASPARIEETLAFITDARSRRQRGTDLVLVIVDRATGEFLGVCGVHGDVDPLTPEFGIWLKKRAHGRALGLEAIRTLKEWCERQLAVDGFVYPVDRRNIPSRRIPEALGGTVVAEQVERTPGGSVLDQVIYRVPLSDTRRPETN
jgi:[ribosomal protein S5]-alanine N-acetyltransferase